MSYDGGAVKWVSLSVRCGSSHQGSYLVRDAPFGDTRALDDKRPPMPAFSRHSFWPNRRQNHLQGCDEVKFTVGVIGDDMMEVDSKHRRQDDRRSCPSSGSFFWKQPSLEMELQADNESIQVNSLSYHASHQ
jgi:hypothetical protein